MGGILVGEAGTGGGCATMACAAWKGVGKVSRCLSGIAAAVWARAQQVWVSQRPGQDVHIGPHGPPSRLCVHRMLLPFMSLAQRRWEPGTF